MTAAELQEEIERLRKRVERERRARQEAEALAEQGTRALYERSREMQLLYAIADAANRAPDAVAAVQLALDELCGYTGWPVGHACMATSDPTAPLVATKLWHLDDPEQFASFREVTETLRFGRGDGLPGRVLASGAPIWIRDVSADPQFRRAEEAAKIGLRGGFAIPITAGKAVVAVLEFFSREPAEPDEHWLEIAMQVGIQVGRVFEREARDEADRANRAKSEFLSRMSHELRTPLNAILGFGELLAMDHLLPEQQDSVRHILKGGRHLLNLINEVLDISRIEAGHMPMSPEPVKVSQVLGDALDLIRPLAAQQSIALDADDALACDRHVLADGQRLKQVLLNLLSNSVKYNRRGGSVAVRVQESAGRLRLSLRDTGLGIPAHRLDKLFMPFQRLGAENGSIEGTGLGLALSKGLAELMGGRMGAESTPGEGSTFWIELMLTDSPVSIAQDLARDRLPARAVPECERTLLYIEDNLSNLQLVETILAMRPQYKLVVAMHARLGLELAEQHPPDLILLDLHLPDLDGHEALLLLQSMPATSRIPVLIVSADATSRQIERLRNAGAVAYLTKPLDVRLFLSTIDEIIAQHAPAAPKA